MSSNNTTTDANNDDDNNNNDPYAHVVDNYMKYIENVEATIGKDNWLTQKIKTVWSREMKNHPTIFAKAFSDDLRLLAEAKLEVARIIYEMENPS